MKINIIKLGLMLSALTLFIACNEDDFTGDSKAQVSSPSLSVSLDGFTNNVTLIESETSYSFTVSLSAPQIVDISVTVAQVGGTATEGDDFSIPHTVRIPAGSTSASGLIEIHADETAEDTETAIIKITSGTEANVSSISEATVTFNIQNVTGDDLTVDATWDSSAGYTDNLGNVIDTEDYADLELLIVDTAIPFTTTYLSIDAAAGFESFVFSSALPDGEYNIAARFYSAADFGGDFAELDVTLDFNQTGLINHQMVTIPAALNTQFTSCQTAILAKITKTGTSYAIEPVGLPNGLGSAAPGTFVGDYLIEEITPFVDGPTLNDGSVVTLTEDGDNRSFMTANYILYCSTLMEFVFTLDPICGIITIPGDGNQSNCSCGGNLFFTTAASPSPFDPSDDSVFEVAFTNDAFSDCGPPAQTVYRFTKQ